MIQNSCTIHCLAKAYGITALSVHRTALAMSIDCKVNGMTYDQTVAVNNRLIEKNGISKNRYLVTVVDNTPEFHSILSLGDCSYWCPNYGFLPKMPKDYLLHNLIDLHTNDFIPHVYDPKEIMKYCNANCNKRITTKTVRSWLESREGIITETFKHILYYRHVKGY